MDGSSYTNHNVWSQNTARSPLSPGTPTSGAAYRANVNRQKTKKWVEAKPQSYDGDEWGDDYGESEDPVPAPPRSTGYRHPGLESQHSRQSPVPAVSTPSATVPPPPHAHSTAPADLTPRGPSPSGPSGLAKPAMAGTSVAAAGPPSLHIHTQQDFNPVPVPEPRPATEGSEGERVVSPQSSATAGPSGPSSVYSHSEAGYTPASLTHPSPVATQSGPIPNRYPYSHAGAARSDRPADAYRRIGEEFERERLADSPQPGGDSPATPNLKQAEHAAPPEDVKEMPLKPPEIDTSVGSGSGTTVRESSQAASLPTDGQRQTAGTESEENDEAKRYSSSPRLPNLARMSAFAVDDLFPTYPQAPPDAPAVPTIPEHLVSPVSPDGPPIQPKHAPLGSSTSPAPADESRPGSTTGARTLGGPATSDHLVSRTGTPASLSPHPTGASKDSHSSPRLSSHSGSELVVGAADQHHSSRSQSPLQAEAPAHAEITQHGPGSLALNTKVASPLEPGEVSPVTDTDSEAGEETPSGAALSNSDHGSRSQPQALPPLHTLNSPGEPQETKPSTSLSPQPTSAGTTEMTPIAPLNPHRDGEPTEEFVPPPISRHEGTMSTITSPSPVKESDRLREEIMNSLSPVGSGPDQVNFPDRPSKGPNSDDGDQSSPSSPGVHVPAPPDTQDIDAGPVRRVVREPPTEGDTHKRFSWEDGPEQVTVGHEQDTDAESSVLPPPEQDHGQPNPIIREPSQAPAQSETIQMTIPPSNAGTMSHQVSQVSNMPRDGLNARALEPPSPVSVVTDRGAEEPPTLSISGKDSGTGTPPPVQKESPSQQGVPAVGADSVQPAVSKPTAMPPQGTVKLMTFKDILAIPSPPERIKKYDETRVQFMRMDTGLSSFLDRLKASTPELANVTSIFPAPLPRPNAPQMSTGAAAIANAGGPHGHHHHLHSQPSAQQPYYQQYLQASSPTQTPGPGQGQGQGMPPPPPPQSSVQHQHSDFKHPGNQIGHKSKELLSTAMKGGKGLLHKGRNKLRGTGDKTEEQQPLLSQGAQHGPPPPSHLNKKADRRTSWGLLGGRTPLQKSSENNSTRGQTPPLQPNPSAPSPAPQLPEPSRISPFSSISQGGHSPVGPPAQGQPGPGPSGTAAFGRPPAAFGQETRPGESGAQPAARMRHEPQASQHVPGAAASASQTELVSPVSETHSTPAPDDAGRMQAPPPANQPSHPHPSWEPPKAQPAPTNVASGTQASRLPPSSGQTDHHPDADDGSDDWVVVPSESKNGFNDSNAPGQSTQTVDAVQDSETPARHPSFVGLPPIRRTSTFGLSMGKKGRGLGEESSPTIPEVPPLPDQPAEPAIRQAPKQQPVISHSAETGTPGVQRIDSFPSMVAENGSMGPSTLPRPGDADVPPVPTITHQEPAKPPQQANSTDGQTPMSQKEPVPHSPISSVSAQRQSPNNQGQFMPPIARLQPGIIPSQMESGPVNSVRPPPGWRVEESHLSEPLLRRRAASNAASNASDKSESEDYGIDKETEAGLSRPKNRGAKSFPGQQQRQGSTSQAPPSPRPETDHTSPLSDRRGAPVFQSPGQQQQTPAPQIGPDHLEQRPAAAPALVGDASRERRHSGFPGFAGGGLASPSSPGGDNSLARSRESIIAHSSSTADQRAQETPSPQFPPPERKRTMFSMNSFTSSSHQKPPKPGISRSSTSNSISNETPSAKKRFSGLTNMFQKQGSGQGHAQRPPSNPQAGRTSLQGQPSEFAAPQPPFAAARPGSRDRSHTTGSDFLLSGDGARRPTADLRPGEPEAGRGRRAVSTGTGFLSGLFNRSSSNHRDGKTPQGPGPVQMYAPSGAPIPHLQGPRMMSPQGQGGAESRDAESAQGRPQAQNMAAGQAFIGRGGPHGQFQMQSGGPGQPFPAHTGPQPYFAGPQGANQGFAAQPGATPRPPQIAEGQFEAQQPRPPVPPATSPSPLSQRSQAIAQPPPADGVNIQSASQKAPSSFSVTTPASSRPDDAPVAPDKRASSPLSRRNVEPPVGRSPFSGPRTERFSQQSSQGSPSMQSTQPASTKSPQQQNSARFSGHGEGIQRPVAQPNDGRRVSTPSVTQSSPAIGPPAQQQQRLSVQADNGGAASDPRNQRMPSFSSTNGPGTQLPPHITTPGQQQLPPGFPRSNTQTTQLSNPPDGMPRPQFLSQQQSFASTHSGNSGHESHMKGPKLFGFKSKPSNRGANEGEKAEKKPSILSAFKKNYRQPEQGQQPVAVGPHSQQFMPGQNGPQFGQQFPQGPMPGPQNQFHRPPGAPVPQMQRAGAGPPVTMNQRPIVNTPGRNSIQGMSNIAPGHPRVQQPPGPAHAMPQGPHGQQESQHRTVQTPGQEPQYDAVPIPQAYRPVHGDGTPMALPYSMMGSYFVPQQGLVPQGMNQGQPNAPTQNAGAPSPHTTMQQGAPQSSARLSRPDNNTRQASASISEGLSRPSPRVSQPSVDANRPSGAPHHLSTGPQVQRHPSDVSQPSSVAPLSHAHGSKPSDVSQMSAVAGRRGAGTPVAQHSRNQSAASASSQKQPASSAQFPAVGNTINATNSGQTTIPTTKTPSNPHPASPMDERRVSDNVTREQTTRPASVDPAQPAEIVMVSETIVQATGSPVAKRHTPTSSASRTLPPIPQEESATQANGKSPIETASPKPDAESSNDGKVPAAPGPSKGPQPAAEEKQVAVDPKDQEEKILVEADQNPRHGDEEEQPMMSATSYPGQEWNPYGNFEDWD